MEKKVILKKGKVAESYIGKYRGECSMKTWLCTVARNLFLDHCKKAENRNLPLDAVPESPDSECLERKLADKMQALEIHRMLHRLEEPGAVFGRTENWARVAFFRAKKLLIAMLEQEGVI